MWQIILILCLRTTFGAPEYDNGQFVDQKIFPKNNDAPVPVLVEGWPRITPYFGQPSAVAVDPNGFIAVFDRYDRFWNEQTFNETEHYQHISLGPIRENAVRLLRAWDGLEIHGFAKNIFYMPHGLTIDIHGNYWLTDVALHQVMKFDSYTDYPVLTLGKRFQPGSSANHFCKPTSVAVASTGEIFVADGYCNSRILKFNAAGQLIRTIPQPPEFLSLQVPHGLALLEKLDILCIADRENMRVVCPKAGIRSSVNEGSPAATIQEPDMGRVFGVVAFGDYVYAINGPTSPMIPIRGFTIDPTTEQITHHWGEFENPHGIAVNLNDSTLYISELSPPRVLKYVLV